MNKKLLTLAIGAALAAPMLAQAEVKITGYLNMSADLMDVPNTFSTTGGVDKRWNVSSNASFFKIDVSEDLGGGMKALGVIQEFVRMDNLQGGNTGGYGAWANNYYYFASQRNTNRLQDGEAYVGLSSGFGTVLLGSMDTPSKKNGRIGDFFGNQIGDSRNLDVNNTRAQNSVSYTSPSFAGVTVAMQHSTNLDNSLFGVDAYYSSQDGTGNPFSASQQKLNSVAVTYKGGPLTVGAAYEIVTPIGYFGQGRDDEKWTNIAASFDVGPATIKALYQTHDNVAHADNLDKSTMGLGASFKLGQKDKVKLQYYVVSDKDTAGADTNSGDAKMIAIGFDHSFSKSFTGYVAYAQTENDANKRYTMAGGGHGDSPVRTNEQDGETMSGLSFGAILTF